MENSTINAVGVWFYSTTTHRYLYLLRNDPKHPGAWGLAGGKVESNETLLGAIERECNEELGYMPEYIKLVPLEKFTSSDLGFSYHTFFCQTNLEFIPKLNDEHIGYAWIDRGAWPKPMHPGLWNTVNLEVVQQKLAAVEQSELNSL